MRQLNIFIQLQGEAVGTRFAANDATREAMSTLIKGNEWMIFTDLKSRQQHWDFASVHPVTEQSVRTLIEYIECHWPLRQLSYQGPASQCRHQLQRHQAVTGCRRFRRPGQRK
jgi:hypothetical protein